mgnify:CR=1 FL=1
MATFEVQVEGLTGLSIDGSSSPTQNELSQFLKDGVVDVINKLTKTDKVAAMTLGVITSESGSGTIIDGAILDVWGSDGTNDHPAQAVPASIGKRSVDSSSLSYRSKYNPCYYREGKRVIVKPDGGSILHITYPSVAYDQETIYNIPNQYISLIMIYAGIKALGNALSAKTLPNDLSIPILELMNTALPTFTEPSGIVMPASLANANISFSLPDFPTFVNPASPDLSNSSVALPGNIPLITEAISAIDYDKIGVYIETEEDIELAGAKIQEMGLKFQEYQGDIQKNLNAFNASNVQYQASVQKALQDAQLESQDDAQKIQKFQADVQAEAGRIQNAAQEYQQKLQKDLQTYQAETGYDTAKLNTDIQKEVQRFTQDLAKETAIFQSGLAKYQAEISKITASNQSTVQLFGAELQKYGSEVQKAQADYQWMQGRQQGLLQEYYGAFAQGQPAPQQEERKERRR